MAIFAVPQESILSSNGSEGLEGLAASENTFVPIGLNKPLTVQIRHVYTGKYPQAKFFSGRKDMLVTSAFKDATVFNSATRAVNFLKKDVGPRSPFNSPAATEQGTPLVSYTPAVISSSTILTLEIVFDQFPDELFTTVSSALASVGGIPLFIPASGYLMAASNILKLAGNLGHALFDGKPVFAATETLDFDVPGAQNATADFRVVCNPFFDPSTFKVDPKRGLIDPQTQQPYQGDEPYIILSLDGRTQEQYASFTPTAASAAVMERFFSVKEGSEAIVDTLVDALKLYNDSQFRAQADVVKKSLDAATPDSDQRKKLQERYNALVANILSDVLKPVSSAG
jgi:hypothetical protein